MVLGSGINVFTNPQLGTVAFDGNLAVTSTDIISVAPRDAVRWKVYLAQFGVCATVDAGAIDLLTVNPATNQITVSLIERTAASSAAAIASVEIVRVENIVQVGSTGILLL